MPVVRFGEAVEEKVDEQRNVVAAIAQRRHVDVDDVEPVEQVFAEQPLGDEIAQVLVRRRDHAHVHAAVGAVRADFLHVAGLEKPQQQPLHAQRHLADFVEEDGAVGGHLELAGLVAVGAGEAALDVSEQLGLEQRLGNARAVDGDERPLRACALRVNRGGDELLADAAFAGDRAPSRRSAPRARFPRAARPSRALLPINRSVPCPFLIRSLSLGIARRGASAARGSDKFLEAHPAAVGQRREHCADAISPRGCLMPVAAAHSRCRRRNCSHRAAAEAALFRRAPSTAAPETTRPIR